MVLAGAAQGLDRDSVLAMGEELSTVGPGLLRAGTVGRALERRAVALLEPAAAWLRERGGVGTAYEVLLDRYVKTIRKRRGSYFTSPMVAREVLTRVFGDGANGAVRVLLDPAMGAGRFLLEALAFVPATTLYGMDTDPLAVWIARVSLALVTGSTEGLKDRLRVGDALAPGALDGFQADVVVGNPPWLAHAGRQAVPLSDVVRRSYRARFRAFAGFPTTHGMFIELCARLLGPGGRLGLLVPTQVADLKGYGPTRAALTARARVIEPLQELGFGDFPGVIEPVLILLARHDPAAEASEAPWRITERQRCWNGQAPAVVVSDPVRSLFARLNELPKFSPETFGEAGFQTAASLARTHVRDWPSSDPRFVVALRQGRDVEAFYVGPPSQALWPDSEALARAGTRLRPLEVYARVSVVIRQTARYPIAAVHDPPLAFRNSLLAGFTDDPYVLVALLNSTLLRAMHLVAQRDGRQVVFPQVKVAHLRALPAPPVGVDLTSLRELARAATQVQRVRWEAIRAFGACPRGLFAPEGEDIPARPTMLARMSRVNREQLEERYEATLAVVRNAWRQYRALLRAIDDRVFALYELTEQERSWMEGWGVHPTFVCNGSFGQVGRVGVLQGTDRDR